MTTTGKRYDKDFKLSAAKMVIERGRSTNSVVNTIEKTIMRRFCRSSAKLNKNACQRGIEPAKKIGE